MSFSMKTQRMAKATQKFKLQKNVSILQVKEDRQKNSDNSLSSEAEKSQNDILHSEIIENESVQNEENKPASDPPARNLRDRSKLNLPSRYKNFVLSSGNKSAVIALISEIQDITTLEALNDANWKKAVTEEMNSFANMGTWELIEASPDVKIYTCLWVLSKKQNGRFKARLVIRGCEQKDELDFADVFSPVAQYTSIRLMLSLAASNNMKIITFDIKSAYLHGDLDQVIYMYQPEGFDDGSGRICLLKKNIYGLKKGAKNWNSKISHYFKSIGLENTDDDVCIYYNKDRTVIISLFVDDGLAIGVSEEVIMDILRGLNKEFEATFDTEFKDSLEYLGMQIRKDQSGIFVNQSSYTEKILKNFDFATVNIASTPMEKGMLTREEDHVNDHLLDRSIPYRQAIGSLLYLSTISRPDISFAVNYLSRFSSKPKNSHWKMIKRVFQYLKGSIHFGIHFDGSTKLIAYTDSDYEGDLTTGQSTSGVLVLRGGPIVWYAKKQHLVATSTAEAEYRAAVCSIDDRCWIRRLEHELNFINLEEPVTLFIDNWSAIYMLKSSGEGKISKAY